MNRSFPSLSTNARARYFTFFFSYLIQGVVPGLFLTALINYYGRHGFSVGRVGGIVALVGLPWCLQFLWGPIVDGYRRSTMGGRRFWQVTSFFTSSLCLLTIFCLIRDPLAHWRLLTALLVLHSACASLMDVSVDALMIDHVPEAEKGKAGSAGRTGVMAGTSSGALLFSFLINHYSFHFSVGVLCLIWFGVGMVLISIKEAREDSFLSWKNRPASPNLQLVSEPASPAAFLSRIKLGLSTPIALKLCLLFLGVDFFLSSFGIGLNVDLLQKYGWTDESLSRFQGLLALFGGTLLSVGIGFLSDRIGHFRALRILLAFCGGVFALIAVLFSQGWGVTLSPLIVALQTLVPSFLYVAAVPAILSLEKCPVAATRFTLIMNAMDFGDILGAASAGGLVKHLPAPLFAAVVAVVMLVGSAVLRRPKPQAKSQGFIEEMPALAA